MKRGLGGKWFNGDELAQCELWIERSDRNEVNVRVSRPDESGRERDLDVYLTVEECDTLVALIRAARAEVWRRA